jgi:signal transduction histidine kinase
VIPPVATEHPLRVLIAEDNEDLGAYLRDILMPEYRVEVTANGRVALDAARRQPPDILITDVMMPEMDGIDLLSAMKTDDRLRSVPVILLTAKASRDEIVKGLNAGADDYLSKPFGPAELTARVRSMARLHESTRALEQERRALHATLDELRQAQEQLVHAGKMAAVGTLVAGLAHELNNPLGVILMNAQSLARTAASESREAKALAAVERNARRCSHMVRSLLDVSRRKPRTLQSTTIEEVVSRVLELAQAEAWRRGIQLHSTPSGPAVPRIHGSPEDLEAALFNLVGNALDATPGEGSVCLSVKPQFWDDQPGIEVSVQDTGSGISPEILPRIFDPFFTSKPAGQGTGLGLSLTRKIVESHGGRIQVDSQLGSGTVFRIWLPAEGAPRVEAAPASLPAM